LSGLALKMDGGNIWDAATPGGGRTKMREGGGATKHGVYLGTDRHLL
jgi:hypothetical protein